MKKISLDFIVMGAMRAGTTSLSTYLNESKDIFIPKEKEIPFFQKNITFDEYRIYLKEFFSDSKKEQLIGTTTPIYYIYPEFFKLIKKFNPDAKLIFILRDPIKRLISHIDHTSRLGFEKRSYETIISHQLNNISDLRKTKYLDRTGKYIVASEYGRILNELSKIFDKNKILLLQLNDFKNYNQLVKKEICDFLKITLFDTTNYENYSKKVNLNAGGKNKIINIDHHSHISSFRKTIKLFKIDKLIPEFLKNYINRSVDYFAYKIDNLNVDNSSKTGIKDLNKDQLILLKNHFLKDAEYFKKFNFSPYWIKNWANDD
tara:strand:- start:14454 stop:15404 length:951 start_codon:yes stop_codon:yes gene_type:complete